MLWWLSSVGVGNRGDGEEPTVQLEAELLVQEMGDVWLVLGDWMDRRGWMDLRTVVRKVYVVPLVGLEPTLNGF